MVQVWPTLKAAMMMYLAFLKEHGHCQTNLHKTTAEEDICLETLFRHLVFGNVAKTLIFEVICILAGLLFVHHQEVLRTTPLKILFLHTFSKFDQIKQFRAK